MPLGSRVNAKLSPLGPKKRRSPVVITEPPEALRATKAELRSRTWNPIAGAPGSGMRVIRCCAAGLEFKERPGECGSGHRYGGIAQLAAAQSGQLQQIFVGGPQ